MLRAYVLLGVQCVLFIYHSSKQVPRGMSDSEVQTRLRGALKLKLHGLCSCYCGMREPTGRGGADMGVGGASRGREKEIGPKINLDGTFC